VHRHQNASTAGMERRHCRKLELGSNLVPVEWVAYRTGSPLILALDSSPDPLARVVRPDRRPLGEHVEPLLEEDKFP
jgi:hypothetical protein